MSNHDGRIMPSNHVQQNLGLHTTLKPAVNAKTYVLAMVQYGFLTNNSLQIQQVREKRCETSTAQCQTCHV